MEGDDFFAVVGVLALLHNKFEGGTSWVRHLRSVQQRVHVPAGHEAVLRRHCDDPRHFVGVLAVSSQPSDRLAMVPAYIFDRHCVLGVEVLAVQHLEGAVIQRNAELAFGVDADLPYA